MKLIEFINTRATWKRVIILAITSSILATCIMTLFFGNLKLDPGAAIDSLTFYTGDYFFNKLDIQGEAGRESYLLLHVIDYLFITQFYTLMVFIINLLVRKLSRKKSVVRICLVPLLAGVMDLSENILIDISIFCYPVKISLLGDFAGIVTFIKINLIYLVFILTIILLIWAFLEKIKARK